MGQASRLPGGGWAGQRRPCRSPGEHAASTSQQTSLRSLCWQSQAAGRSPPTHPAGGTPAPQQTPPPPGLTQRSTDLTHCADLATNEPSGARPGPSRHGGVQPSYKPSEQGLLWGRRPACREGGGQGSAALAALPASTQRAPHNRPRCAHSVGRARPRDAPRPPTRQAGRLPHNRPRRNQVSGLTTPTVTSAPPAGSPRRELWGRRPACPQRATLKCDWSQRAGRAELPARFESACTVRTYNSRHAPRASGYHPPSCPSHASA